MNLKFLVSCIFSVQVVLLSINFIEAASVRKRRDTEDDTMVSAAVSTTGEDNTNTEARIGINVSPGGGITLPGTGSGQVINQNTVIKGPTAIYGGGGGGGAGKPKKPQGPAKCTKKRCRNKVGKPRRPPTVPRPAPVVQPQPPPVVGTNTNPITVYNGLQDEDSDDDSENAHDESESLSDAQEDEDADPSVDQDASEDQEQDQEQDHDASEEQDANEEQDEDQAEPEADEDE